jgi:regulation of enolase protein 1 (concanavalin A-like superfamily)
MYMFRSLTFLLVTALAMSGAGNSADDEWEKIESKTGGYYFELPGKPTINKTREIKEAGGKAKMTIMGCVGPGGMYLFYKIAEPTAILKGGEEAELDSWRDYLKKELNGSVLEEKKIKDDKIVGRDFTVQGKPDDGPGITTIRVRAYLFENTVYLMQVTSITNRELPEDTGRFLGSLKINGTKAEGTFTEGTKGNDLAGWGVPIDPLKECEFTAGMNRLSMKIIGSDHQKMVERWNVNAPRIMREVEGDFTLTVKVVGEFRPGGKSTNVKAVPWHGAGIIVWNDVDNYIRLERAASNRNGKISPYVNFEEFSGGTRGGSNSEGMKEGDCWLRMDRRGSKILGGISFDGTTWKELKPIEIVWPTKLSVGLQATTSSGILPWSVSFEGYDLKVAEKAKKKVD